MLPTRASRLELPSLAADLIEVLYRIQNQGILTEPQLEEYRKLHASVIQLQTLQLGVENALNSLQYQIDDFRDYFWIYDSQHSCLEQMLELVSEYLTSPRYGFRSRQ